MRGTLYLALRYLAFHRFKSAILVTSIALILYVPVGLRVLVDQSSRQLTARAEVTPLILGARYRRVAGFSRAKLLHPGFLQSYRPYCPDEPSAMYANRKGVSKVPHQNHYPV